MVFYKKLYETRIPEAIKLATVIANDKILPKGININPKDLPATYNKIENAIGQAKSAAEHPLIKPFSDKLIDMGRNWFFGKKEKNKKK